MNLVTIDQIVDQIHEIRGQKVMIDSDLAELYGVTTGRLNERVKRNIKRFPLDFMFRLIDKEFSNLKSQFVISSWGGRRKNPYAFTEQGVSMLSSVLNSDRAISINIEIMRIFTRIRQSMHIDPQIKHALDMINLKINELGRGQEASRRDIDMILETLDQMRNLTVENKNQIGFKI